MRIFEYFVVPRYILKGKCRRRLCGCLIICTLNRSKRKHETKLNEYIFINKCPKGFLPPLAASPLWFSSSRQINTSRSWKEFVSELKSCQCVLSQCVQDRRTRKVFRCSEHNSWTQAKQNLGKTVSIIYHNMAINFTKLPAEFNWYKKKLVPNMNSAKYCHHG